MFDHLKDPSQPQDTPRLVHHFLCHLNSGNFHCDLSSSLQKLIWVGYILMTLLYDVSKSRGFWIRCHLAISSVSRLIKEGRYWVIKSDIFYCVLFSLFLSDRITSEILRVSSISFFKRIDLTSYDFYLFPATKTAFWESIQQKRSLSNATSQTRTW